MSEFLGNFHFIRPLALGLIAVAIAVWLIWRRANDPLRGWRKQIEPELLDALSVGHAAHRRRPGRGLLIAWLLAIVAIAGPTWKLEPNPFADDATRLVVLLKADASMLQPDPAPTRLERAHLKIADLATARPGQPLGLIAYAGSAHLVLPPTRDTAIVADMAQQVSPEIMPVAGDRLDLAIREALTVLNDDSYQGGSLVVFSDSVDTDSALLAELKPEIRGFPIQFLAIDSPNSSQFESIRQAADILGANVESLDVAGEDISAIVRAAARTPVIQSGEQGGRWQEFGYWLVPVIGLLVLASFRQETKGESAVDTSEGTAA